MLCHDGDGNIDAPNDGNGTSSSRVKFNDPRSEAKFASHDLTFNLPYVFARGKSLG